MARTPPRRLARDLDAAIEGEVRFDDGSRALYATDASNHRQVPIGVVVPHSRDDVLRALAVCRDHDVPVLPRGAGTSLAGQACNAAVVLDFSVRLGRILELDPVRRTARVEPGAILDDLQRRARPHGLAFGPDPATHDRCTIGGMLGNDACGIHSITSGRTADNVVSMEVVTWDGTVLSVGPVDPNRLERRGREIGRRGEIHRRLRDLRDRHAGRIRAEYPALPRRVSGYNLDALLPENGFDLARALVGTEGTCATILEATVRLVERPDGRALLVLGYDDVSRAADHVPEILEHGPIGLEGIDDALVGALDPRSGDRDLLPAGRAWLLVEFGADSRAEALGRAREASASLCRGPRAPDAVVHDDPAREARMWEIRESGLGATARTATGRETWPGWEDSAVHPDHLGAYLRDLGELFDEFGFEVSIYGHFGDGCVHCRIPFDLAGPDGIAAYRRFVERAAELACGRYGGSLSGEHGDGIARGALLRHMYPDDLIEAMGEFKRVWDPDGRMNPGRVVEASRPDELLRLEGWSPPALDTAFAWPDDDGDFARAALRCVGVGACRRTDRGTMCPSYRVTREEAHSTRGRARLLFEMLRDDTRPAWDSDAVEEALDLCLACKACKRECPASVDMASYKAEFLHHRYEGRLRPRSAYSMGRIRTWARLASRAPAVANAIAAGPLSGLLKRMAGIAPERALPRFARETFTRGFVGPFADGDRDRPAVLLWPDTFHDHFEPEVAHAATRVLEAAGYGVLIPSRPVCCGRPLYDFGLLDLARRRLREVLEVLREPLRAGIPVIGLEPSCVAVFRDELVNLLPDDPDARRLGERAVLLEEFLVDEARWDPNPLGGRALLHVHCHQEAVLATGSDRALLERMGVEVDAPDTGCCGMAGAFGFERDKLDVSVACAEDRLLPAVRAAEPDTWIVTNGFSCREQIRQLAGRRARHLAEILAAAIEP